MMEKDFSSQQSFAQTEELYPDAFALLRPVRDEQGAIVDFTCIYENAAAARLNGTDPKSVIGAKLLETFPEIREMEIYSAFVNTAKSGKSQVLETSYSPGDGASAKSKFWFRVAIAPSGQDLAVFAQEITNQVRAEQALRESNNRFHALFSHAPVPFALSKIPEGIFLEVNSEWLKLFGYKREEVIGKSSRELGIYEFAEERAQIYEELKKPHGLREFELRMLTRSGARRLIRLTLNLVDIGGEQHLLGAIRDLTDQRLAEIARNESRAKFEAALTNMADAVLITDRQGNAVEYNKAYVEFHRFIPERLPTTVQEYLSFLDVLLSDGSPAPMDQWPVARALRGESAADAEFTLRRKDTGETWIGVYSYAPIRDDSGEITGTVIVGRDITFQKRAEEALRENERRFRTFAEAMPQMAFIAGPAGEILYCNRRYYDYLGRSDDVSRWNWRAEKIIHPEDYERTHVAWTRSIRDGTPYENEYRIRRADGRYRWHLARAIPVRDEDGAILQWLGTNTDIDDQMRIALDLQKAIRVRDEFLSIASHELKTPLTTLKLQSELLKRKVASGDPSALEGKSLVRYAEQNDRQLSRLARLVEDMLDVSRIESGRFRMQPEAADFSEIVVEAIERLQPQIQAAGVRLFLGSLPSIAGHWDRFRIEQVVTNLITNALRYGGGKPFEIQLEQRDPSTLLLSIRDQGIGISEGDRERIFNRFERAVSSDEISGMGLGLFISREIVHRHGGRIWAESAPGSGAVFRVELPASPSQTLEAPPPPA